MSLKLTGIELPDDADFLWKYMSFEKFVSLLGTKSLYFTRADKFEDPLEGFTPVNRSTLLDAPSGSA